MSIVTAILARNEAGRDLPDVLARAATYSDQILLLDDRSTDSTPEIARKHGAEVRRRAGPAAWGAEAPARAELWDWAVEVAKDGWILINDADMLLEGDPRPLTGSWSVNTWSWVLYDLWSDTAAREDEYWVGHLVPRPWMVCPSRVPEGWVPEWPDRGIHCGHLPLNWPMVSGVVRPEDVYWRHHAYITPSRRRAKWEQYQSQFHQMSPTEQAHARSILALD